MFPPMALPWACHISVWSAILTGKEMVNHHFLHFWCDRWIWWCLDHWGIEIWLSQNGLKHHHSSSKWDRSWWFKKGMRNGLFISSFSSPLLQYEVFIQLNMYTELEKGRGEEWREERASEYCQMNGKQQRAEGVPLHGDGLEMFKRQI